MGCDNKMKNFTNYRDTDSMTTDNMSIEQQRHMKTRQGHEIAKAQLKILQTRIKNKPMDKHVEKYIAQLQALLQAKDKRICELLAENSRLILDNASLRIDLERVQNGYEEGKY